MRATLLARFDYSPPLYHQLKTNLIESKKLNIEKEIKKKTDVSIATHGISICTDSWDDVNHRPLMNVMMSCPASNVFLDSIDTSRERKTMVYIVDQLKAFIQKIGPWKVTQICTNNAKNILGIKNDIVLTYPHIFKQGCALHALNVLLKD